VVAKAPNPETAKIQFPKIFLRLKNLLDLISENIFEKLANLKISWFAPYKSFGSNFRKILLEVI
jgi:hypothetical protein